VKLNKSAVGVIATNEKGVTGIAVPKDKQSPVKFDMKQITKAKYIQRVTQYNGYMSLKELCMQHKLLCGELGIDYIGCD